MALSTVTGPLNGLTKHHILEAIDKLRSRKSRPDVMRIVSYVSKKYEFPKTVIRDYLEQLSKEGTVLKVEFKGSISYRNAAHYQRCAPRGPVEMTSRDEGLGEVVTCTIAQLIVKQPDYLYDGISASDLFNQIDLKDKKKWTKPTFRQLLDHEVAIGNLARFDNGNYCLGCTRGTGISISPDLSENSTDSLDKSKVLLGPIQKFASPSMHTSPFSSTSNSPSHMAAQGEGSHKKIKPTVRTYAKPTLESKLPEDKEMSPKGKEDGNQADLSPLREGSRRKRVQKIVFDPSDSPKPKKSKDTKELIQSSKKGRGPYKKQTRYMEDAEYMHTDKNVKKEEVKGEVKSENVSDEASSDSEAEVTHCKICNFTIEVKSVRPSERWLSCRVCNRKAHAACIEDTEHWTPFKFSKWQCNDCKPCVACKDKKGQKEAAIILCGICYDAYHIKCANIKKGKVSDKWFCVKCSGAFNDGLDAVKAEREYDSVGSYSNETSQRSSPEPEKDALPAPPPPPVNKPDPGDSGDDIDESIPDCSSWTSEEVYNYFLDYVTPQEADIFRDQEIDGKVLLLLSRYDVLSDFKMKLGPALKIYAQVKKLQLRRGDRQLFWP